VERVVAGFLQQFTYPAMLLLLVAAGMGVPVSEDLVLLLGGAISSQGFTRYVPTLLAGYGGVIAGDALIYHWGKKLGPRAYEHKLARRVLSRERAQKLHEHFGRHGFWTVVAARHMPGLRPPIFFLSGASGVRFATFLLADMLSAAVTVPAVVTIGYFFGSHLEDARRLLHRADWIVAVVALAGVGVWWFLRRRRRRRLVAPRDLASPRTDVRERTGTRPV
jgi:membrane protein DedA with SNARE-associated domain